jgi:hypothetical protein
MMYTLLMSQHHCDPATRNVKQFGADHKRRLIGDAIIFQPTLTKSVAAGEELCINYGDDWCESAAHGTMSVKLINIVGDNNRKWYFYASLCAIPP